MNYEEDKVYKCQNYLSKIKEDVVHRNNLSLWLQIEKPFPEIKCKMCNHPNQSLYDSKQNEVIFCANNIDSLNEFRDNQFKSFTYAQDIGINRQNKYCTLIRSFGNSTKCNQLLRKEGDVLGLMENSKDQKSQCIQNSYHLYVNKFCSIQEEKEHYKCKSLQESNLTQNLDKCMSDGTPFAQF